jgi:hypothetical protein
MRHLMDQAIDNGDFETAKALSEEVESLDLYDRELKLAETVHTYFTKKQALSDQMYQNA